MDEKVYTYDGEEVTVTWDQKRCIHAEECVRGLPGVFDADRRPWIDPDQAEADAVVEVVQRCPTGALHVTRGGTDPEEAPAENKAWLEAGGPIYIHGQIEVQDRHGETLLKDTRVALCRCGLSSNKPLCDGSHADGFEDDGEIQSCNLSAGEGTSTLTLKAARNGPMLLDGDITIRGTDGGECSGGKGALCRCGASDSKPFCDGSHSRIGFDAQ